MLAAWGDGGVVLGSSSSGDVLVLAADLNLGNQFG